MGLIDSKHRATSLVGRGGEERGWAIGAKGMGGRGGAGEAMGRGGRAGGLRRACRTRPGGRRGPVLGGLDGRGKGLNAGWGDEARLG